MSTFIGARGMWAEARKAEKSMYGALALNRRRREKRLEWSLRNSNDPSQSLRIVGKQCKVYRDSDLHTQLESGENLVPWSGDQETSMDRYDVRSLMDFLPRWNTNSADPDEDSKLKRDLNFHRYRSIISADPHDPEEELVASTSRKITARIELEFGPASMVKELQAGAASSKESSQLGGGQYAQMGFDYGEEEAAAAADIELEEEERERQERRRRSQASRASEAREREKSQRREVFPGLTKKELEARSREFGTRHYLSRMDEDEDDLEEEKEAKEKKIDLILEKRIGRRNMSRQERRRRHRMRMKADARALAAARADGRVYIDSGDAPTLLLEESSDSETESSDSQESDSQDPASGSSSVPMIITEFASEKSPEPEEEEKEEAPLPLPGFQAQRTAGSGGARGGFCRPGFRLDSRGGTAVGVGARRFSRPSLTNSSDEDEDESEQEEEKERGEEGTKAAEDQGKATIPPSAAVSGEEGGGGATTGEPLFRKRVATTFHKRVTKGRLGVSGRSSPEPTKSKEALTPQQRLRLAMQAQLSHQQNKDKSAEEKRAYEVGLARSLKEQEQEEMLQKQQAAESPDGQGSSARGRARRSRSRSDTPPEIHVYRGRPKRERMQEMQALRRRRSRSRSRSGSSSSSENESPRRKRGHKSPREERRRDGGRERHRHHHSRHSSSSSSRSSSSRHRRTSSGGRDERGDRRGSSRR